VPGSGEPHHADDFACVDCKGDRLRLRGGQLIHFKPYVLLDAAARGVADGFAANDVHDEFPRGLLGDRSAVDQAAVPQDGDGI